VNVSPKLCQTKRAPKLSLSQSDVRELVWSAPRSGALAEFVRRSLLKAKLKAAPETPHSKATSPDAALPASGLAVDCWDWPVAYPLLRDERAAPASATQFGGVFSTPVSAACTASHAQASATSPGLNIIMRWTTSFPVLIRMLSTCRFLVKKNVKPNPTNRFPGPFTDKILGRTQRQRALPICQLFAPYPLSG